MDLLSRLVGEPPAVAAQRVGPDDWELFRRVRLAALAQAPEAFGSRYEDWVHAGPERWQARLTDVPLNLVLFLDGEPIGLVSGTAPRDGAVELISLWVAPEARGLGVAGEAVRRVRAWAGESGARRVELMVKIDNTAARGLYDRLGFAVMGPNPDDPTELWLSAGTSE
ncbi:GNAT family N-acetyltransferase [Microlunatus ginsengisoli]|uniref:GNAT family N-acetyltransferase n=1 Tax=Microlunatus ginsengisoli TaxID=363863 RepID=UPI0031DD6F8E